MCQKNLMIENKKSKVLVINKNVNYAENNILLFEV